MASIDRLLICPLCHDRLLNPTTLHCGHSLCSRHLQAPSSSCPVPLCSSQPPSLRIPPHSRVRYTPAQNPVLPAPIPVPDHRSDVVLNKIIILVDRALQADDSEVQDSDSASASSRESSHRPRKRRKQHAVDDDEEPDLLSHLRSVAAQERSIPPDVPLIPSHHSPPPDPALQEFDKKLLDELTCHICYVLFYQPVTTPCQHTYCAKCLQRSLDHSTACPICRQELPSYYFQDQPLNKIIMSIILKAYPLLYQERAQAIQEEERNARLNTPIFVSNLSFPGVPTILHLFEPRYRLMLRRCLESPHPRFGMIMSPKPGAPQINYGTILEIRSVQMLPDGRSLVETYGSARFRILERGSLDGYMVGRIESIFDYPDDITHTPPEPPSDPTPSTPTNEQLMDTCKAFLDRLQRGAAPWVVQRLNSTYGAMPTDPALFSFWVALVLPIEEHEKAKLLPIRSARLRLMLVVHWIEQLNNNWYAWLTFVVVHGWLVDGPALPCLLWVLFVLTIARLIGWI
ncbi:hypothetical protein M413DRAFT_441234 [Hebeloma cylindrosporum]|uniref:RING-type domain-containing protein n=1 Tax=Hebeloma cylindrosporum TaxID=76867 RepID=A0A0C3CBK6_HEBCY|nr:hypothetical protein M413DRAFT_441234 [Hebeloma cylindrosporum h7]